MTNSKGKSKSWKTWLNEHHGLWAVLAVVLALVLLVVEAGRFFMG